MTAQKRDLYIEQGATFDWGFTWYRALLDVDGKPVLDANGNIQPGDPYDLTGAKARMQIRKKAGDPVLVEATTESPTGSPAITLGGATGRVDIKLTAAMTDTLDIKTGAYDFEVEFPDGDVRRLWQGAVTVDPNVTRDVT